MTQLPDKPTAIIIAWMALNVALLMLLIPGDLEDLNNYIEFVLWIASIAGLATMRKAGAAFATAVLCVTLGTSLGNVLLAYYSGVMGHPVAYVNGLRIAVNAAAAAYMFKRMFEGKYE
ncbi:MAG: hypothetical protein ACE14S_01745 [Candidatus Bathyarchaeia archaeon]